MVVRAAVRRTMRSVGGGIALTALAIVVVELVSRFWFTVPQPNSLYLLAVAAAAMLGGRRAALISALIVFAFSYCVTHRPGIDLTADQATRLALFGVVTPAMALLVGGLRKRNDELLRDRVRREVASEQATRELQREHRIAATLQNVLLTPMPTATQIPGFRFGSCYEPAFDEAEVGGDFYDVIPLDHDAVAVVIGDVSGKGLIAAARTAEIKYSLRAALHEAWVDGGRPGIVGEALARVDRTLTPVLSQVSPAADIPPPADVAVSVPAFVCLSVAVVRASNGVGEIAVAGMEHPLVVRRPPREKLDGAGADVEALEVTGLPIGVSGNAQYETLTFRLGDGDLLLLATDGILESRRRGSRDLFGLDGLQHAARQRMTQTRGGLSETNDGLNEFAAGIVGAAKAFAGAATLKDDACALLVQRHGAAEY